MKIADIRLGFIGFGSIAKIIFQAIEKSKFLSHSQILFIRRDAHKMKEDEKHFHITSSSLKNLVAKSNILLLAVQKQQLALLMKDLQALDLTNKLLITLVPDESITFYQKMLSKDLAVIRIYPSAASRVGKGILLFCGKGSSDWLSLAKLLFSTMGDVFEVEENQMEKKMQIIEKISFAAFEQIEKWTQSEDIRIVAHIFSGISEMVQEGYSETLHAMRIRKASCPEV